MVFAYGETTVRRGPEGRAPKAEETMLKIYKNNAHEGAVSITDNGAAARCALGLFVVIVLLLSNT